MDGSVVVTNQLPSSVRDGCSLFCRVWLLQHEAGQLYCVRGSLETDDCPPPSCRLQPYSQLHKTPISLVVQRKYGEFLLL